MRHSRAHRQPFGRRVIVALVAALALLVANPSSALAHYYAGGGDSASVSLQPYSINATWDTVLDNARIAWNSTSTPAVVWVDSSSPSWITVMVYPQDWYGQYTPYGSRSNRYFEIEINTRTIYNDATNWDHFARSTSVHELGHRLSLDDIDTAYCTTSIMSHCRDRNTMYTPQTHDINDVNSYY